MDGCTLIACLTCKIFWESFSSIARHPIFCSATFSKKKKKQDIRDVFYIVEIDTVQSSDGRTPLHEAAMIGKYWTTKFYSVE